MFTNRNLGIQHKKKINWDQDISYAADDAWGEFVGAEDEIPGFMQKYAGKVSEQYTDVEIENAVKKWCSDQDESDFSHFEQNFDDNFKVSDLIIYYLKKHYHVLNPWFDWILYYSGDAGEEVAQLYDQPESKDEYVQIALEIIAKIDKDKLQAFTTNLINKYKQEELLSQDQERQSRKAFLDYLSNKHQSRKALLDFLKQLIEGFGI